MGVTAAAARQAPLTALNTFGVEASAAVFARVDSIEQLRALRRHPAWGETGRPLVLGGGSNILFTGDFPGLVLHLTLPGIEVIETRGDRVRVRVAAGENWHRLVLWSVKRGLYGLENLALIPGNAGAAPIQNIGAYGGELSRVCEAVTVYQPGRDCLVELPAAECDFAYRWSRFKSLPARDWIVTDMVLELSHRGHPNLDYAGLREELERRACRHPGPADVAAAVTAIRRRKLPDPATIGNAGSFFKNPWVDAARHAELSARHPELPAWPQAGGWKISAGWLIEQCGWKGYREGAAGVHQRHALVLVNHGGATGAQILALAERIQASVHERFAVALEPEVTVTPRPWPGPHRGRSRLPTQKEDRS